MKTIVIFDQAESAGGSIARAVDLANEMQEFRFIFITYHPLEKLYGAATRSNALTIRVHSFYNYHKKSSHRKYLESKTKNKLLTYLGVKLIALADLINEYSTLGQALLRIRLRKIDIVQANAGVHILPYRLAKIKNSALIYYFRHLDDYGWAEGKILERATNYIFVGSNLMKSLLALLKIKHNDRCQVIHSPFDVYARMKYEPAENLDLLRDLKESGRKIIVCTSRICAEKGQHAVIEAIKQLAKSWPELTLLIVGEADRNRVDQQYLQHLKQKVSEYQLDDRVVFLGHRKNPLHILQYADIAVQAPTYFEALAGSLVEAVQLGIPTISADIGGASEVLIQGKTGFLFQPGDHNALASIIDRILRNPKEIVPIIAQGKTHALQNWNPIKISAQLRAIYSIAKSTQ